jgi:hypothetical protein
MADIDMATALEISLPASEQEAKFVALKNLHTKKVKALMLSLDVKDKEIAKLKVLGKDSRKTEMIQRLRTKIKDQELLVDTIKEELGTSWMHIPT